MTLRPSRPGPDRRRPAASAGKPLRHLSLALCPGGHRRASGLENLVRHAPDRGGRLPSRKAAGGRHGRRHHSRTSDGIQQAASAHNVSVRSVAPNPVDPQKITLGLHGDFRDMMAFLGRLETFQVAISGFDFAPDESGGITGTVELLHTGKPGAPASFADYLDALVSYTAIRNPFEIGDPVPVPNAGSDLGDLSWTYHLTSISQFGATAWPPLTARIIGSATVWATSPSPPSVLPASSLTAPHQTLVQKIHFRRNPGARSASC